MNCLAVASFISWCRAILFSNQPKHGANKEGHANKKQSHPAEESVLLINAVKQQHHPAKKAKDEGYYRSVSRQGFHKGIMLLRSNRPDEQSDDYYR